MAKKEIKALGIFFLVLLFFAFFIAVINAASNETFNNQSNIIIDNQTNFSEVGQINETQPIGNITFENQTNVSEENNLTLNETIPNKDNISLNETPLNESLIINQSKQLNITENNSINKIINNLIRISLVTSPSYFLNMFTIGLYGAIGEGIYNARVHSTADYIGTKNAASASYSANIGFFGTSTKTTAPTILSYEIYPKTALNGSIIRFFISASNYNYLWLNIALPDGNNLTINLTNNNYSYYTATELGNYPVTFYAQSSSGAITSIVDQFTIVPESTPVPPSGNGPSCNYIWDCSSWSLCNNNEQSRICENKGTCTGTSGKPIEVRNCSEALFDVILGLKNVNITEDEHLTFHVDLIEKKSTDKVDVQINYNLLDENNTVIFNQMETRAIQNNLSYDKTFDQIKLKEGKYKLTIDITYGNKQKANAQQTFEVNKNNALILTNENKNQFLKTIKDILSWIFLIILLICVIYLLYILLKKLSEKWLMRRSRASNLLSEQIGKKVYSEDGDEIGLIREIYLAGNSIYGWIVDLVKEKARIFGKATVLIRQSGVASIKEVMIIKERIKDILVNKNNENVENNENKEEEIKDTKKDDESDKKLEWY